MEFNEFREKVKEALPDFLTDDLRNAEIKDTAVNKLQGESYSGISVYLYIKSTHSIPRFRNNMGSFKRS